VRGPLGFYNIFLLFGQNLQIVQQTGDELVTNQQFDKAISYTLSSGYTKLYVLVKILQKLILLA